MLYKHNCNKNCDYIKWGYKKTVNNEKTNKIKLAKIWKILILINFNCKYK